MTDNEIIKYMQCVIGNEVSCSECTYQKVLPFPSCRMMCAKNALDLINRQKAEILELQKRIINWRTDMDYRPDEIKSEAIKEFAERLKHEITSAIDTYYNSNGGGYYLAEDVIDDIDNIVKEMTEVETIQRKEDEGK